MRLVSTTNLTDRMSLRAARRSADTTGRHGMAFIVEALILLAFLVACIAVFMQLLGSAGHLSEDATKLDRAVQYAVNAAEQFAADPVSSEGEGSHAGLTVTSDVTEEAMDHGTLYHAHIVVTDEESATIYELDTSKYLDDRRGQRVSGGEANG